MEYRSFLSKNSEHLISGLYLWCWIYYDFAYIFAKKTGNTSTSGIILNSTSHGMICLLLLWMLRSLKNVQQAKESKLTRIDSFSTFVVPFIIHFALAMFIMHRIDQDLDLPENYEYIYPNWIKYVTCTFFMTFVSTELLMVFRDSIESLVSENKRKLIEVICYFIMIFIIRILFHIQVSLE